VTSPFNDLDAALSGAIREAFAEEAVLRHRVSEQYVERAVDPDRPSITVTGVFSEGQADERISGSAGGATFTGGTRATSTQPEFWIEAAQAASLSEPPKRGDALILTARAGSPTYTISHAQKTDMGDLNLILTTERTE